jgi:streptogramin lyase
MLRTKPAAPYAARSGLLLAFILMTLALSGCGVKPGTPATIVTLNLNGKVRGGQQPVAGSTVQLYAVGNTGNASAASPLIPASEYYLGGIGGCVPSSSQTCYTSVLSDGNGNFSITGDYACPASNPSVPVYLAATGGNPGLTPSTIYNNALVMVVALGPCNNLRSSNYIVINEVTTVAAAWALAPFMSSYANVGSSATNSVGIANAFLNARLLVNPQTGLAATLPSTQTVETGKLYALADVLAPCVNSDGTTGCSALFAAATPSGGSPPADTLSAALNIVKNPGQNVHPVFSAKAAQPPFATTLTQAPNDWTMSLTTTGAGMSLPTALGIDSLGNVWVANYNCPLDLFSPQAVLIVSSSQSCTYDSEVFGLAVDPNSDVWITDEETPYHGTRGSVTKFNGDTQGQTPGTLFNSSSAYFYDNSVDYPYAVAADTNGDVATANFANSSASILNGSGTVIDDGFGTGSSSFPVAIAFDSMHGIWLANQSDNTVTHIDSSGNIIAHPACCDGANGIATDSAGNAWVTSYYNSSVAAVTYGGSSLLAAETVGGINHPAGLTIDANQNVWVVNYRGDSLSEVAGISDTLAAGTAISPSPNAYNAGGYGLDASLDLPFAIAVDPSGDLWVTNYLGNDLVMFFGLAAPTKTPSLVVPTAP